MPQHVIYNETHVTGSVESQIFQVPPGRARGVATIVLSSGPSATNVFDMLVQLWQSEDGQNWEVRHSALNTRGLEDTGAAYLESSCSLEGIEDLYLKVTVSVGQATVSVTVTVET